MVGTFENVGFKFDRWLDSVLMQRALGDGATTKPSRSIPARAKALRGPTRYGRSRQSGPSKPDRGRESLHRDQLGALSSTRSTRSSSWPRRTIRPVADTTL